MKIKGIKEVNFFGVRLLVDTDVYKYIACDEIGDIYGYAVKPNFVVSVGSCDLNEWRIDDDQCEDDEEVMTYFGNYFNLVIESKNIDACGNEFYSMTDDLIEDAKDTLIKL